MFLSDKEHGYSSRSVKVNPEISSVTPAMTGRSSTPLFRFRMGARAPCPFSVDLSTGRGRILPVCRLCGSSPFRFRPCRALGSTSMGEEDGSFF